MVEETSFTISVDAFGDRPDRSDPKEPLVDPNISNPTPENHTRDHTLENASVAGPAGGGGRAARFWGGARIRDYDMLEGLKVSMNLKTYDGTSDPDDHLSIFMGTMDVHKLLEPAWCLEKVPKTQAEILGIRQRLDESLRDYLSRFGKETLHMTNRSDGMMTRTFISGLHPGRLFKDLIARPSKSMEDLFIQEGPFSDLHHECSLLPTAGIAQDQVDWKQRIAKTKATNEVLMTDGIWSQPCHESRMSQPSTNIAFLNDDSISKHCNGDNPLIIKVDFGGCMIHRIYMDGGSSIEIMYEHCFQQLSNEVRASIRAPTSPLVGFAGQDIVNIRRGYMQKSATILLTIQNTAQTYFVKSTTLLPPWKLTFYFQLMADNARRGDRTFNWETATYGKVYCDDLDSFTDFETDFPAIVYNDASKSNHNFSSEPTVSIYNAIKTDVNFHISFSDYEDDDYTFIYNKDSSSYKLIPVNDLKPEPVNEHLEINTESCSENNDIKPTDIVICTSNNTTSIEFDENIETNHDAPGPCCKEIDDLVYSEKRRVLNSYGHSDASSTHFCSRTQIGESSRATYQGSSLF
ncbi:hypothetical protein Tco_0138879 [Tanacetum coccineum]